LLTYTQAIPVIRVPDMRLALDWYEETFGFEYETFPEQPPYQFAMLFFGSMRIMMRHVPGYHRDPRIPGWDIYVTVEGGRLRDLYEDVKERATVIRPLMLMPYGHAEFDVLDLDGHILCIAERLADPSGIPEFYEPGDEPPERV
jgi:uncharacterized glyoxalase superfamily protein PhnB